MVQIVALATKDASMKNFNPHKKVRDDHHMELIEDYLEEVLLLGGEARIIDLSRHLGVSHVTVIKTVKRIEKLGYLKTSPYKSILLTTSGKSIAKKSQTRHELVVAFLKKIGVSSKTAENDAEGIEHHVSDETLRAFKKLL